MNIIEFLADNGYTAEYKTVNKDGVMRSAIEVFSDGVVHPVIYLDNYNDFDNDYDRYNAILETAKHSMDSLNDNVLDTNNIVDWAQAKSKLQLCIRPVTEDGCTTIPYLDCELYVRIMLPMPDGRVGSVKVTDEILKYWNMDKAEIFAVASANFEVATFDFMGLNVISNKTSMYGAAVLAIPEILANCMHRFEMNECYILPSSIHEVLMVPVDKADEEMLRGMVRGVNDTEVAPEERLSYNIYYFDGTNVEVR